MTRQQWDDLQRVCARLNCGFRDIAAERRRHGLVRGESLLAHLDVCDCPR